MNVTKFWKRTLIGGAAALTLAAGLIMTTGVDTTYAQDAPDTPDTGVWEGKRGGRGHGGMRGSHFGPFGGGQDDERKAAMAESLGVTVEELDAAQEAAHDAAIQEALANGDITQEQVDLMEAGKAVRDYVDPQAVMTEALGVTVEDLEAAREDGTLRELFSGLDRAEIGEQMKAAMDEALSQAVADGVITQEQADQLQEQGGERGFGGKGFGKPDFSGRGFGQSDGEGRGERGPGGFFNQSDG